MVAPKCSDAEFVRLWQELSSPSLVAKALQCNERAVLNRRKRLAGKLDVDLATRNDQSGRAIAALVRKHEGRIDLDLQDGIVIVFSDAHYWPKVVSTAHRALLIAVRELQPRAVVCNGDAFDGSTISRFPRPFFDEHKPTVADELATCQQRLGEIEDVAGNARLTWNIGNHDLRFEAALAAKNPEYQGVQGFHLKDHFPKWKPAWSTWINGNTCVKHRWNNGVHATYNNTLRSGVSMVTAHLHKLQVTPYADYTGRRYGVDTGTLADPYGSQFIDYTEANPVNWQSGFVVLTYHKGKLLPPECLEVLSEGVVTFRGQVIEV